MSVFFFLFFSAIRISLESPTSVKPVTPYMHHYLVEAMLRADMKEEALAHIKSYWGAMVRYGADTFWEIYVPSNAATTCYDDHMMNSFCHAWSCAPSYFIRKYFVKW